MIRTFQQFMEAMALAEKNWIKDAINPKHKGFCTPRTKKTCTPRRLALAKTLGDMNKKKD